MIKNKVVLLLTALAVFLTTGMTAQAVSVNCPTCAMYNIETPLKISEEHVNNYTLTHPVEYDTENGIPMKVNCTVSCSVDKTSWYCLKGHGTVYSRYHHVERHTCSRCKDRDYYTDN